MKKLKRLSLEAAIKLRNKLDALLMFTAIRLCEILSSLSYSLKARLSQMQLAQPETSDLVSYHQLWFGESGLPPGEYSATQTTPYVIHVVYSPDENDGPTGTPKPPAAPKPTKQKSKPRTRKSKGAKSRQKRAK